MYPPLLLFLSFFLASNALPNGSSPVISEGISSRSRRGSNTEELTEASEWLAARGIRGLCHPTSEEYAPAFPKCLALAPSYEQSRKLGGDDYYRYQDDNINIDEDDANIVYQEPPRTKWSYIFNGSMTFACVVLGALASGLTVGLLSLDPLLLVIKMRAGETEQEKHQAGELLPLVKQHHRLLVTLLLLNTIAGEALPVFLQSMVPDAVAILISVVLVLVFGEILPTALFTGPNQIQIASRLAPMVRCLMFLLFPITHPIARLLDRIMMDEDHQGDEELAPSSAMYNRGELAALIRVQYEERLVAKQRRKHNRKSSLSSMPDMEQSDINIPTDLRAMKYDFIRSTPSIDNDEVVIVEGALQMRTKKAMDIFVSFRKVFCIPCDMTLDETNIFTIYASGYSRVPVYVDNDRRLVKGILMTRQLMVVKQPKGDGEAPCNVSDMNLHVPQCVGPETNLVDLVNLFQTGGCAVRAGHMALVCARPDVANVALEKDEAVPEEAGLMGYVVYRVAV